MGEGEGSAAEGTVVTAGISRAFISSVCFGDGWTGSAMLNVGRDWKKSSEAAIAPTRTLDQSLEAYESLS